MSESQKKEIAKLQGDLDLNQRQVKSALEILGEKNVPPERLAAVKAYPTRAGMPYQRFIRQALEAAVQSRSRFSRR